MTQNDQTIKGLLAFLDNSPTAFHAVASIEKELQIHGFTKLTENADCEILAGKGYYMTRNNSSLIAFKVPQGTPTGFMICASHSDSPTFKVKPNAEIEAIGKYVQLNTERYGGMILSSWLDRPLSVAGRVAVESEDGIDVLLVDLDDDLLVIPNVAPHMNRTVNSGYEYNARIDTLPLMAHSASGIKLAELVANACQSKPEKIIGHDLFLYCRQKATVIGADGAFFLSPRIDNLECAWTSLQGFLTATPSSAIPLFAVFDNEETGSQSKQGAASNFLPSVIDRIIGDLSLDKKKSALLHNSFMLSADNAHAMHPNHPELADGRNAPHMNGGIVIKYNASQRYTTDGVSAALFKKICQKENIPTQTFANRSDMAGGSTLGTIANTKVSIKTVDIGLAQLAMHSACETAGVKDVDYMVNACRAFFSSAIYADSDRIKLME